MIPWWDWLHRPYWSCIHGGVCWAEQEISQTQNIGKSLQTSFCYCYECHVYLASCLSPSSKLGHWLSPSSSPVLESLSGGDNWSNIWHLFKKLQNKLFVVADTLTWECPQSYLPSPLSILTRIEICWTLCNMLLHITCIFMWHVKYH